MTGESVHIGRAVRAIEDDGEVGTEEKTMVVR